MHKEISQHLLEKYYRKECSAEEAKEVILWLRDPENRDKIEIAMRKQWEGAREASPLSPRLETIHSRILEKMPRERAAKKNAVRSRRVLTGIVSLALVTFFVLSFLYMDGFSPEPPASSLVIKSTGKGEKLTTRLPDGTMVILNTESSLTYPAVFTAEKRSIRLKGEAFFEVAEDKSRPFVVRSGPVAVKAVGTAFNVKAVADSDIVVSLAEGKVIVNSCAEAHGQRTDHLLLPGEEITYSHQKSHFLKKNKFDNRTTIGWKDGFLVFDDDDVEELKAKIESWYGIRLVYKNRPALKWRFTGDYENESLENVLKGLKFSKNISYVIFDDRVEITFN